MRPVRIERVKRGSEVSPSSAGDIEDLDGIVAFERGDEPIAITALSVLADVLLPNASGNAIFVLILFWKEKTMRKQFFVMHRERER